MVVEERAGVRYRWQRPAAAVFADAASGISSSSTSTLQRRFGGVPTAPTWAPWKMRPSASWHSCGMNLCMSECALVRGQNSLRRTWKASWQMVGRAGGGCGDKSGGRAAGRVGGRVGERLPGHLEAAGGPWRLQSTPSCPCSPPALPSHSPAFGLHHLSGGVAAAVPTHLVIFVGVPPLPRVDLAALQLAGLYHRLLDQAVPLLQAPASEKRQFQGLGGARRQAGT